MILSLKYGTLSCRNRTFRSCLSNDVPYNGTAVDGGVLRGTLVGLFPRSPLQLSLHLCLHLSYTFHASREPGTARRRVNSKYCRRYMTTSIRGTAMMSKVTDTAAGMLQAAMMSRQLDEQICRIRRIRIR